ncbi:MAG: hypothetical protein JXN64_06385 [Spirochaetes bacterium]|nr:hypothetical protein [Spirochaetota bacterium]
MSKRGKIDNLIPVKTKEEARERGRNGGIKSGKARKERKLLSEIYKEILAKRYNVKTKGKSITDITDKVLSRGDSATVSLLREMREATEGSMLKVASLDIDNNDPAVESVLIKHGIKSKN